MYSAGPYNSVPMGFQYPVQAPIYQPPPPPQQVYGGYHPQVQPHYQPQPAPRGHSLPATTRQYQPPNIHYPQQYEQYPPPSSSRHFEHRHKKYRKQKHFSPRDTPDHDLYSDKEKSNQKSSDDRSRSQSKHQDEINNSQSPVIENLDQQESQDDANHHDEQQQQQDSQEKPKRKSRSRRKKHQRYEQYNPQFYTELPPHARAHQQPLYNNYNQPYEDSMRRPNIYQKPPPQSYPTYNPYQPYANAAPPPPPPQHHQGQYPASHWSHLNKNQSPSGREIQRLRNRIQTLENQLNKLQKKFGKVTLTNTETSGQEEPIRKHRRTKRDRLRSPRQTPVIVELNTTTHETLRESSSKQHRHRTPSNNSSQQTTQSEKNSQEQNIKVDSHSNIPNHQSSEIETKNPPEDNSTHIPAPPPVQQTIFPSHGQPSINIHYPNDLFQQQQQQQPTFIPSNHNHSNNNETLDPTEEQRTRSAEKILDAFERFYIHTGRSPLTPIKVKFIPEDNSHNQNVLLLT